MADTTVQDRSQTITIGQISGTYGVRGWVRVRSFTEPDDGIFSYIPWRLCRRSAGCAGTQRTADETAPSCEVLEWRRHPPGFVARMGGVEERDAAFSLVGLFIVVPRSRLPKPEPGEYYWADLIGLRVETTDGQALGVIESLMQTGANDVLVVRGERERLIPFLQPDVVTRVDLQAGRLVVDWDVDF